MAKGGERVKHCQLHTKHSITRESPAVQCTQQRLTVFNKKNQFLAVFSDMASFVAFLILGLVPLTMAQERPTIGFISPDVVADIGKNLFSHLKVFHIWQES